VRSWAVLENGFGDAGGGIWEREASGGGGHGGECVGVTELVANYFCENFPGELGFWNEDGGSSVGEDFGVGGLMIFGGVGIRNEDAGDAEVGEFGEAGGSAPSDGKTGGGVDFFHTMMERSDPSGNVGLGVAGSQSVFVITATEVDDLQWFFVEVRQRLEDSAVDSLGALASAHHEEGG